MTDTSQPRRQPTTTGPSIDRDLVSAAALLEIVRTAVCRIAELGVTMDPAVQVGLDTLAESVLVHEARHDPGALTRALAAAEADLAAGRSVVR